MRSYALETEKIFQADVLNILAVDLNGGASVSSYAHHSFRLIRPKPQPTGAAQPYK